MECLTLTPSLGVIPCEYPDKLYLSKNYENCPTWRWKLHDRIFILLNKTPECDGKTDRRTESLYLVQRSALPAMRTRCNSRACCIPLCPARKHQWRETFTMTWLLFMFWCNFNFLLFHNFNFFLLFYNLIKLLYDMSVLIVPLAGQPVDEVFTICFIFILCVFSQTVDSQ